MGDHPQYRTILTADIEGYGRPARTNPERVKLRRHLAGWCDDLLGKAGVRADRWCRQDTGDGWIVSIDPHLPRDVTRRRPGVRVWSPPLLALPAPLRVKRHRGLEPASASRRHSLGRGTRIL